MTEKLDIKQLKMQLGHKDMLRIDDIAAFYRQSEPLLPQTTLNWRIHNLVGQGILQRIGRGIYRLGETKIFIPQPSAKMKSIASNVQKNFPYINFCVWELSVINYFGQHLINYNVLFVDTERDATESVYYRLKESHSKVMLVGNLYADMSEFADNIIVRPLPTGSPLQNVRKVPVATLEKILVDLAVDKEFLPFQGNEMYSIYQNAFDSNTLNENTMLRYASRKRKRDLISNILKTIKRQQS